MLMPTKFYIFWKIAHRYRLVIALVENLDTSSSQTAAAFSELFDTKGKRLLKYCIFKNFFTPSA